MFSGNYIDLTNKPIIPIINDASTTSSSLWSSTKINSELGTKANTIDVYTKTNVQTAGQASVNYGNIISKPANIDEDRSDDVTITGNQSIAGNKTFTNQVTLNNGINASNSAISNLKDPVNDQDAATKSYVDKLEARLAIVEDYVNKHGTLEDIDGNNYKTVLINDQDWMAENLKVTRLNNGGPLSYRFPNNDTNTVEEYGLLYGGIPDNLCPSGWHVATDLDWRGLEIYLGMDPNTPDTEYRETTGGNELKLNGSTEFNAIFPGYSHTMRIAIDDVDLYECFGNCTYFWSKADMPIIARILSINPSNSIIRSYISEYRHQHYLSVRCVKN